MSIRGLIFWLVFLAIVGVAAGETLTIATYNVENYGIADRMTEEGYRKEYPKPETEKQALRAVIRGLNADVLLLQEVGPKPYFEELKRDLKAEGLDYPHAFLLEAADPDRHVAILSRRPFKAIVPHVGMTFPYFGQAQLVKRGMLEVTFAGGDGEFTLFGVHLKSRFTDRLDDPMSAQRRLGEATVIRDAILGKFPDPSSSRFLILGDFNDGRTSKPLQRLERRGKTEIATLLPATDSRGETWTHAYHKEDTYSRVDHVLVSSGLRAAVRGGAARIHDQPEVRDASDHRPVVVVLELGK
ncbi:MAG: endonuclease [Verrucomicrobia bacterium]|nr:endonuclease [Verrucomicrobiota bacterium]